MSRVGIHSVGVHLPKEVRRNDWWPPAIVDRWREKAALTAKLFAHDDPSGLTEGMKAVAQAMRDSKEDPFRGAVERRVMAPDQTSSDMETAAAQDALAKAELRPEQIDLLMTNSQLPDYLGVANAPSVHRKLGIKASCLSLGTEGACNSFLQQLSIAAAMIQAGTVRFALLIQSSGYLHLARPEDPQSAWFGDAATAVVVGPVGPGKGLLAQSHKTDGTMFDALVTGCPGARWYSDQPVHLYVANTAAARKMLVSVADMGREVLSEAFTQAKVAPEEVDYYASHQATPWFRSVTQKVIGMTRARSVDFFPTTGSLAAANIPFGLASGEREGLLKDGDLVAMYSGGSGITWSGLVLKWGV